MQEWNDISFQTEGGPGSTYSSVIVNNDGKVLDPYSTVIESDPKYTSIRKVRCPNPQDQTPNSYPPPEGAGILNGYPTPEREPNGYPTPEGARTLNDYPPRVVPIRHGHVVPEDFTNQVCPRH